MSAFKADARFLEHENTPPSSPEMPRSMHALASDYEKQYAEELWDVYIAMREHGQKVFGASFLQMSTLADFAAFVFRNTQPGAK